VQPIFHRASNGTGIRPKFIRSQRKLLTLVDIHNLPRCCITSLSGLKTKLWASHTWSPPTLGNPPLMNSVATALRNLCELNKIYELTKQTLLSNKIYKVTEQTYFILPVHIICSVLIIILFCEFVKLVRHTHTYITLINNMNTKLSKYSQVWFCCEDFIC
jgi:hypothetical protein